MEIKTEKLKKMTATLKRTKEMLYVSEDKYRMLVENANCIILRISKDGKIIFFNEFAQKFFGYTEQEIIGKNIIGTIISEKDNTRRDIKNLIRDIKLHPKHYATYENESICKNGKRIWVVWANKAIHDEQSNVTEILCVGHNITERKIMENELRLLATAVRNSNDAITILDLEGDIIAWNLGAERTYGYNEAEAIKMNINRIFSPTHSYYCNSMFPYTLLFM